jgi:hypothetical protein
MSPITPPPRPTTNDCRSSPAAIIWSQIAPACASVFDFSLAGIVINVDRNPVTAKLSSTRLAKSRATLLSEMIAHVLPARCWRTHVPTFSSKPWPISTRSRCLARETAVLETRSSIVSGPNVSNRAAALYLEMFQPCWPDRTLVFLCASRRIRH